MKHAKHITAILLLLIFVNGCVNLQELQTAMDDIDSFYGEANRNIISSNGSRTYSKETRDCLDIAIKTIAQLGFEILEVKNDSILTAKALTPTPFTLEEFEVMKKVEEPMLQAMAAKHVGKFYSNFFILGEGIHYVIVKIYVTATPDDKSLVRISFQTPPKNEMKDLIIGHNPPPEFVRKGLEKWWNAFETNLNKEK